MAREAQARRRSIGYPDDSYDGSSDFSDDTSANDDSLTPDARSMFRSVVRKVTGFKSGGILLPKDSLYGSVIVLPQIARSLGNHPFYVGKALIAWTCLILVLLVQSLFVYEVYRMVATKDECCTANPQPCIEEGFSEGGHAWFGSERNRWYLCYPQAAQQQKAQILRKLCVVAFVICLFKDLRQSYEMAQFLWKIPNETGTWMVVVPRQEECIRADVNGKKKLVREVEAHMEWQVDSLEFYWKILLITVVLVPKILIFAFLYFYGSMWLLNVDDHKELILNAVALVFVLDLDEAVFAAVTTADVQQYMDNLQPWNPLEEDIDPEGADADDELLQHAPTDHWSWADIGVGYLLNVVLGVMTFPVLLLVCSYCVIQWYDYHCDMATAAAGGHKGAGVEEDYCIASHILD